MPYLYIISLMPSSFWEFLINVVKLLRRLTYLGVLSAYSSSCPIGSPEDDGHLNLASGHIQHLCCRVDNMINCLPCRKQNKTKPKKSKSNQITTLVMLPIIAFVWADQCFSVCNLQLTSHWLEFELESKSWSNKSHLHGEVDAHELNAWFQTIERWSHSESCKPSLLTKENQFTHKFEFQFCRLWR